MASELAAGETHFPLYAEDLTISRRQTAGDTVQVRTVTRENESFVDETLHHERVQIDRIPIGRQVDAVPPVRQEGDTTILSVVEEIIIVERRLILKEEVHIQRLHVAERHREAVILRKQEAVITRIEPRDSELQEQEMPNHTVVAVYETAAQAAAAVRDLQAADILPNAISQHTKALTASGTAHSAPREQGFWGSLFGSEHDTSVYDRSVEEGASVLTVRVPDDGADRVTSILESHNPIDLDERAAQYTAEGAAAGSAASSSRPASDEDTIRLAEESLAVGKRAVSGGTTRVRRYVVETPVEEQVTLQDQKVVVDRRPVTGGQPGGEFTDKTIEMTETHEEPVVSKTARVTEEVSLHKEATDRVETVRDTVRRDEVEVEQVPGTAMPPRSNP